MNLKQLHVFVAVAESASFSRGAEATFITQSTVSQHISALEDELGVRLLDRTSRGALVTDAGRVLLRHARLVLAGTAEIYGAIARFKGVEEGGIVVGASNVPGNHLIPGMLPRLLERYPKLTVTVHTGDSREVMNRVECDEIRIGIIGTRFDADGVIFEPVGHDDIALIAPAGHPWAGRDQVTLEEVVREPLILREAGSGTEKTVREGLTRAGVDPETLSVRAYLGSNEAIKNAVCAGVGISFLSSCSVRREVGRGEIVEIPVKGVAIRRPFYLTYRSDRELSPASKAFIAAFREAYPS